MNANKSSRRRKNVLTNECGQTIDEKSKQLLFYECAIEMVKQVALKTTESFSQSGANQVFEKYAKKKQSTAFVYCLIDRLRFQRKGAFRRTFRKYLPYRQIKHFFVFPSSPSIFMLCITDEITGKRYYETYRCRPEDVNAICDLTYKASIDPQNILRDTDALRQISVLSKDEERTMTQSHEPSCENYHDEFPMDNNQKPLSYFDSLERQYPENDSQYTRPDVSSKTRDNDSIEPTEWGYRKPQSQDHISDQNFLLYHSLPPGQLYSAGRYQSPLHHEQSTGPAYPRSITITRQADTISHHPLSSKTHTKDVPKPYNHYYTSFDSPSYTSELSYPKEPGPFTSMQYTQNQDSERSIWTPSLATIDDIGHDDVRGHPNLNYSAPRSFNVVTSTLSTHPSSHSPWKPSEVQYQPKSASTHNLHWGDRVTYIQYDPHDGPKLTDDGPFYMYITRHESQQDVRPHASKNESRTNYARSQPNLYM